MRLMRDKLSKFIRAVGCAFTSKELVVVHGATE